MFKPGDLVMVVKPSPCCGDVRSIGRTFTVVKQGRWDAHCMYCFAPFEQTEMTRLHTMEQIVSSRLRLIPPLSEPETTEREVEHAA